MNRIYAAFALTLALAGATTAASGADPRLLNFVMPNASMLAGANVAVAETTPFGQYVVNQMTSSLSEQLNSFTAATGFDPKKDITEILAATTQPAAGATKATGLILALGNFDVPKFTAAIAANSPKWVVQTYKGATLIAGDQSDSSAAVAFPSGSIAIAGDSASVKAALDRSGSANAIDPALLARAQSLSSTNDAWTVTSVSALTLIPGLDLGNLGGPAPSGAQGQGAASPLAGMGALFSSIQSSSGGVKFGNTVEVKAQAMTNDPTKAKSLTDILTGLVGLMAMSAAQTPAGQKSAAPSTGALFVQLLQGLKVTTDGPAINLALSVPETQLEALLNSMKAAAAKPAAAPKAN